MLYFVATPIGNLKDISLRAIEILKDVDIIACEDTRTSLKLLDHYEIKKRLIAYHKNNEIVSANGIIELLKQGKSIAVISDAGMPVISDPGNVLIKKLKEENQSFTIIPGANAGLCGLILSGFDATRFTFVGFLPEKNSEKKKLLDEIKNYKTTLIFYLSPHGLEENVKYLAENLGERNACLVNEITKMFEKTYFFKLGQELNFEPKGEYVLVVEGNKNEDSSLKLLPLDEHIAYYENQGLSHKEALKKVAKDRGEKNIYKLQ